MNVGAALETNAETTEVMQPGMRVFDDPAIFAKACHVRYGAWRSLARYHDRATLVDAARSRNHDRRRPHAACSVDDRAIRESVELRRSEAAIA